MKSLFGKQGAKNKQQYTVPASVQVIFTFSIVITFLIQLAYMTYSGIQQYGDNPEMGGFYSYFVSAHLLPALMFLIAYAMNPRELSQLSRSFESLLFTTAALSIWWLFTFLDPAWFIGDQTVDYLGAYATYQIVSSAVMVALYTGVLYWLRRSKRWA